LPPAFSAFSQRSAAARPSSFSIALSSGWKSVSDGAKPTLPAHCGEASSRIEVGSLAAPMMLLL
jgi:hypothetical protein